MSSGREVILGRIRRALKEVPAVESPLWDRDEDSDPAAAYARRGLTDRAAVIELFSERCGEYRATVVRCHGTESSIAGAVHEACTRHGIGSVVHPPGLPAAWIPEAPRARPDRPPLTLAELDATDLAALTGCALAIALTGTIALDGGDTQGRRALTLVPDVHICVVRAEQIVCGVPEAIETLGHAVRDRRRALTLISGPSATSDIELERVEGVHGPRQLEVIVAGE